MKRLVMVIILTIFTEIIVKKKEWFITVVLSVVIAKQRLCLLLNTNMANQNRIQVVMD